VGVAAGNTASVTINGITYHATVLANHTFSFTIPVGDVAALADQTTYGVDASVPPNSGNSGIPVTSHSTVVIDETADVGGNLAVTLSYHLINNAEKTAVGFSVAGLDNDATAIVTFSDGNPLHDVMAVVSANGSQTAVDLSGLIEGPFSVSISASDS